MIEPVTVPQALDLPDDATPAEVVAAIEALVIDQIRALEAQAGAAVATVRAGLGIGAAASLDTAPAYALEAYRDALVAAVGPPLPTVGSSDVAAILGLSPWAGPWDTWARLTGLAPRYSDEGSPATDRGRMLEPAMGGWYAQQRGLVIGQTIIPGPPIGQPPIVHPVHRWMACRPDFLTPDRVVEAKTSTYLDAEDGWGESGSGDVPTHYAAQVAWQLAVMAPAGLVCADLIAFGTVRDDWRVYHIERRERTEAALVARIRDWYERHIIEGHAPPIDGSAGCGAALTRRYAGSGETREADATDLALARDLARVRAEIATLEDHAARVAHAIQDRMGEATRLRADGHTIATWSTRSARRSIDTAALRAEVPDLVARHTTEGKLSRRFTLMTPKEP